MWNRENEKAQVQQISDENGSRQRKREKHSFVINIGRSVSAGITFGSALAMIISYTAWKSIGWAIFHGLLSWAYVIYYAIRY